VTEPRATIGPAPLPWQALSRPCTAEELVESSELVAIGRLGQERAHEALEFGMGMRYPDYHLFALGPAGVAKHRTVLAVLATRAALEPSPPDDCYVHRFDDERRPQWLRVPAGRGVELRGAIAELVVDLEVAIPTALTSEDYRNRRAAIAQRFVDGREQKTAALRERALAKGVALSTTPGGFALAPMREGKVVSSEQYDELPESDRRAFTRAIESLEQDLAALLLEIPQLLREAREETRKLQREAIQGATEQLLAPVRREWTDQPAVLQWLDALLRDIVQHGEDFAEAEEESSDDPVPSLVHESSSDVRKRRYAVNVLVDRSRSHGAPVVYEDDPTLENLLGRIEHRLEMDTSALDPTLIVPGALHRVNGGYLVLDAAKVLAHPSSWDALKRALFARQIRIDTIGRAMGLGSTVTLEPEPIPLDVKCVLIGDRAHYEAMCVLDPEFEQLFKVPIEFTGDVERTPETTAAYAALVDTIAREASLRPFERAAVARVVDHGARLAGHSGRLSLQIQALSELVREADHHAGVAGATRVDCRHVDEALAARRRRVSTLPERVLAELREGRLRVATSGELAGQVNGLTIVEHGGMRFSVPARITARARLGEGELLDIERETQLGGPIHSKGVLILAGFIGGRYFTEGVLGLRASLVFEQSYGGIEGDSASLAELCALLSAIAELPAKQSVAMTGSVDQLGSVQPVGAVNEKIEGFYDACVAKGLDGTQGVVIPRTNVPQLMLRSDVVDAVRAGRFRVWAVDHADEAFAIVFGRAAGERDVEGRFPPGSVNALVEHRLQTFASTIREMRHGARRP